MPFALIAAALASLGIHAVVLFVPEVDLAPHPEPAPLQAEIVLKPRTAADAKPPSSERKPLTPRAKPAPRSASPTAAATPAPALDAAPADVPESAPVAEAAPAELGLPPQGEIVFSVSRGEPPALLGRAVQSWDVRDGGYRITNTMETVGLAALLRPVRLVSESRGRVVATGLEPALFTSRRQDKETGDRVEFDWPAGLARFSNGSSVPLPAGAQDLLSFNFQLGWLSKTGDMSIATAKKLARYRLELVGEELLETRIGLLRTLHFRAPGESTTDVWLAGDHHLLPVRIRYLDKKGESYDQLAEEIRIPK